MKEMTIRISDLKLLVEQLFKADAYNRARISVFTNLQGPDATAVHEMTYQTEQALPAVRLDLKLRYRQLKTSLQTGEGVDVALRRFLNAD